MSKRIGSNKGQSKNVKKLCEIAVQIGRNQSVQHLTANMLSKIIPCNMDKIKGDKPTKQEYLDILWGEMESLISDLHEWIDYNEIESEPEETESELEINSEDLM